MLTRDYRLRRKVCCVPEHWTLDAGSSEIQFSVNRLAARAAAAGGWLMVGWIIPNYSALSAYHPVGVS